MSFISEFSDYDGDFVVPKGFVDNSWHNDVCPRIWNRSVDQTIEVSVWQDYVDPEKREYANQKRYTFDMEVNGETVMVFNADEWKDIEPFIESIRDTDIRWEF